MNKSKFRNFGDYFNNIIFSPSDMWNCQFMSLLVKLPYTDEDI